VLELVERDSGIEAVSDDLYSVAKELAGGADHGARMSRLLQDAFEEGAPPITAYQRALLRSALEAAGVEFTKAQEPGVRLKAKGKSTT
jgi:hypothetical protein